MRRMVPPLPRSISPLEDHDDLEAPVFDPLLKLDQLDLEVGEDLLINLPFQLFAFRLTDVRVVASYLVFYFVLCHRKHSVRTVNPRTTLVNGRARQDARA